MAEISIMITHQEATILKNKKFSMYIVGWNTNENPLCLESLYLDDRQIKFEVRRAYP